jgi:hypothetical protein
VVVSFMVAVPSRWFGRRSVRPDRRTDLIGHRIWARLGSNQRPLAYEASA